VQAIGDGPEREARSRGGGLMAAQRERPPTGAVHDAGGTSAIGAGSGAEGRGVGGGSVRGGDDRKRGPGRDQPQGAVAVQGPQGHSRRGKFLFFVIFLMMNGDV
jgi:hypothetical protein